MDLYKQVCNFEQSKKLKEFGVIQNAHYSWAMDTINNRWALSGLCVEALDIIEATNYPTIHPLHRKQYYSAFTVAELGVMLSDLNNGDIDATSFYNSHMGYWDGIVMKRIEIQDTDFTNLFVNVEENTEAEARAGMLIWLIENNHIAIEEVNVNLTA